MGDDRLHERQKRPGDSPPTEAIRRPLNVPRRADAPTLAARNRLRDRVNETLVEAGIRLATDAVDATGGARVEVDPFGDAGGGVWVGWSAGATLRRAAIDAVSSHRFDDPSLARQEEIAEIMSAALGRILTAAGMTVHKDRDDQRPHALLVS